MNEQEWLTAIDLARMLGFLREDPSERKVRLLACACCRRIWDCFADDRSMEAVLISERFADGLASREELREAALAAEAAILDVNDCDIGPEGAAYDVASTNLRFSDNYTPCVENAISLADMVAHHAGRSPWPAFPERQFQCDLLRDIFNNPFSPVSADPSWLTPTVLQLAQAAYDERQLPEGTLDATRLAVLADALEEAGCTNADILAHLRSTSPHVRGCWPVDLLLGKE